MSKLLAVLNAVNGNRAEAISVVAIASAVAGIKLDGDQGTAAAYILALVLTVGDLAVRYAKAHTPKPTPAVVTVTGPVTAAAAAPATPPAPVA